MSDIPTQAPQEPQPGAADTAHAHTASASLRAAAHLSTAGPLDADGRRWPIVIMAAGPWRKAGPNGNQLYTPPDVLRSAVEAGLFEGAKSFLNHSTPGEDKERPERDVGAVIGVVTDTRWDDTIPPMGAAVGVWNVLDDTIHARVMAAHKLGVLASAGSFSITALGDVEAKRFEGSAYDVITQFNMDASASVDFVTEPAAGGRFLTRLAASLGAQGGQDMTWNEFAEAKPRLAEAIMGASSADDAVALADELEAGLEADGLRSAWDEAHTEVEAAATEPEPEVAESTEEPAAEPEPEVAEEAEESDVDDTKIAAAVKAAIEPLVAKLTAAPAKPDNPEKFETAGTQVEAGPDAQDKWNTAVDGFFARRSQKLEGAGYIPRFRNVREMLRNMPGSDPRKEYSATELMAAIKAPYLGNEHGSFRMTAGGPQKLQASVTTTGFGEVFADRAHKRMQMLWHSSNMVQEVLEWASMIDEVEDFKTHRYITFGEYANYSSVSEGATYPTLTTPADVEETSSLTKYGGVEDITFEAVTDPDGTKLAALPDRMIGAMLRTVRETLINEITTTNPTLNSDSTTLYHANHSNTGTTALSISALNAIRNAMRQQTAAGSSKQIGARLEPWGIIIPPELLTLTERIVNPSPHYLGAVADMGAGVTFDATHFTNMRVMVADHFTDATDYFVMANPANVDTFVVQFLRGVREPEFFVQDSPDSESHFNSDTIKYKVRFWLGTEPLEYRAFYRQVVAG